jgi:hypothetical protein
LKIFLARTTGSTINLPLKFRARCRTIPRLLVRLRRGRGMIGGVF